MATMSSSGYILQAAGWGCSCPKGRSINSKKECLAAAHTLVAATEHIQQSQEQLEVLDNIWEFPPCGCFVWKGGYSVIYADPNDESIRECRANQWAQLICREGDVEQAQFEEPDDPTLYEPKKCLDWIGYKPIRFLRDPRFCIGVTKDENGDYQPVVKLCSDVELLFGDEHWWWYNFYNQICIQDDICFEIRTEGKGADPALVLAVSPSAKIENRWSFNSDGRFQSLANPAKYISVAGCELKEGAMLEINSIKDECVQRFTSHLDYNIPKVSAKDICYVIVPFTIVFGFQVMFIILYFKHRRFVDGDRRFQQMRQLRRREGLPGTMAATNTSAVRSPLRENESVRARF